MIETNTENILMRFKTDIDIVLECLHEAYDMEGALICNGKNIHRTMVYPFIKMLETHCVGITEKEIHKKLWEAYKEDSSKNQFLSKAVIIMKPYYEEEKKKLPTV